MRRMAWKILLTVLTSKREEKIVGASISISQLPQYHAQGSRGQSCKRGITKYSFSPHFYSRISPSLKKLRDSVPWLHPQEQIQYSSAWVTVDFSTYQHCVDVKCLIASLFPLFCKGNSPSRGFVFRGSERKVFCLHLCLFQSQRDRNSTFCFWLKEILVSIKVHQPSFYLLAPLVQLSFERQDPPVELLQQPCITGENNSPE